MIVHVEGVLVEATLTRAVLDVGGIGYEIAIPLTTAERLPVTGSRVRLHTLAVYREDSQTLYGFATAEERDFFRLIVDKVQNVGPRIALGVMSALSLDGLRGAILSGDVALLAKSKGVGRKTAERLVLDLKDIVGAHVGVSATPTGSKPAANGPATAPSVPAKFQDAVKALAGLGYKPSEADLAIRNAIAALGPDASVEDLIRRSLAR
jgi:holliday junction DNA helicase RuvA